MGLPQFRFTLTHAASGRTQEISEPLGWKEGKLILENHEEFSSLVERFESSFVFYGSNGIQDGGINFIKEVDWVYGFDAIIEIITEISFDQGVTYEQVFSGTLDLSEKQELPDNKMDVPIIQNNIWTKFIAHLNTPVDLSSSTDLYGNAVTPLEPMDINLPAQKVRQRYSGLHEQFATVSYTIPDNQYGQIDFAQEPIYEIKEKFTLSRVVSSTLPAELFAVEFGGSYNFDIQIYTATTEISGSSTDANLQVRLQINETAAIVLNKVNEGIPAVDGRTKHTYSNSLVLNKGDLIRLYFFNNNAAGASYSFVWPANLFYESHLVINADTVFPSTEAKGYYLHDVMGAIIDRITGN